MEIKVTNKDVTSTTIWIVLDLTITHNGKEEELEVSVEYQDMPNFGTTDITWEVTSEDFSIFDENTTDVNDLIDDFVQEYIQENIGRL